MEREGKREIKNLFVRTCVEFYCVRGGNPIMEHNAAYTTLMAERIIPLVSGGTVTIGGLTVSGTITADTTGSHTGSVVGNLTGTTTGTHNGSVTGDVVGNTAGTHTGAVVGNTAGTHTGNVVGNTAGTHTGLLLGGVLATDLNAAGFSMTSMRDPVLTTDATTKAYVDAIAAGLVYKDPVVYATTANYTATYVGTPTFTLTSTVNEQLAVDGVDPNVSDRILVRAQTDATQNGIYTTTVQGNGATPWVMTRATDFDADVEIAGGNAAYATAGNTLTSTTHVMNNTTFVTLDTDDITWALISRIESPLSTKGDVYVHDGISDTRLPAGADGHLLMAVSGAPMGVNWKAGNHGTLDGLTDDDHPQYALLAGRGGDTLAVDIIEPESASTVRVNEVEVAVPTAHSLKLTRKGSTTALTVNATLTINATFTVNTACTIDQDLQKTSVPFFGGLYLPTIGGTAKPLDHYEHFADTMTFVGPWIGPLTRNIRILRIGKQVTMFFSNFHWLVDTVVGARISTVNAFPHRFRPDAYTNFSIPIVNNGEETVGLARISYGGHVNVGPYPLSGVYGKEAFAGWEAWSATWIVP